jgi:hypothetical protein
MNQILNGESAEAKVAPKSVVKLPLTPGKPKIASDFEVYKYDKIRVTGTRESTRPGPGTRASRLNDTGVYDCFVAHTKNGAAFSRRAV